MHRTKGVFYNIPEKLNHIIKNAKRKYGQGMSKTKYNLGNFFQGDPDYGREIFEKVGNDDVLFSLLEFLQLDKDFNIYGNLNEEWRSFRNDPSRVRSILSFFKHPELRPVPSDAYPDRAGLEKEFNENCGQVLSRIMPSPYIDWGEKKLSKSEGYTTAEWHTSKQNQERMFVFKSDIEFAKTCLQRDYEAPTETNAIMKLCDSRRTGNRRFPRFGWIWPQQGVILGRKELLKHPGKTSEWNSLYAIVSSSPLISKYKRQILKKIDDMEKCNEKLKPVFKDETLKFVAVRHFYHVQFNKKEMELLRPLLEEFAIPVIKTKSDGRRENDGFVLSDSHQEFYMQNVEEIRFKRFASTLKQKEIIDAISILYRKFPIDSFRDNPLYANNREFWETYNRKTHGAQNLRIEDLSQMVVFILAEITKYRGTNGVSFFTGNLKTEEKGGIHFIEDYGMTREARWQYTENYLPSLKPKISKDGKENPYATLNFEYTDAFAASLLKAMFGNGKGYGIAGPIDRLTKYAEEMKQLSKEAQTIKVDLPELSWNDALLIKPESMWPAIHIKNLLTLLADCANESNIPLFFPKLVYALLVSTFPDCEDRYDFLADRCMFYKHLDVANGEDANRKFESSYTFINEASAKSLVVATFKNCITLDEALRNGDMPTWSAAIMKGFFNSASREFLQLFKSKKTLSLLEVIAMGTTKYTYMVGNETHESSISLGDTLDAFLGNFYSINSNLSTAISSAQTDPKLIFDIANKVSENGFRFVNITSASSRKIEAADMAVVQFNFVIQNKLPSLSVAQNIMSIGKR